MFRALPETKTNQRKLAPPKVITLGVSNATSAKLHAQFLKRENISQVKIQRKHIKSNKMLHALVILSFIWQVVKNVVVNMSENPKQTSSADIQTTSKK